jgi:putative ABC transport system substrate-binding protein
MEILKQLVPNLTRIAMLSPRVAWNVFIPPQSDAAKALGLEISYIDMSSTETIETAFQQAAGSGIQGVIVRGSPFFSSTQRDLIVEVAAARKIPVMFERRDFVEQGGLASYAPDSRDLHRRAGEYVARIMGGAKAGDLPIQQPSKFQLLLNLKTAKGLGLVISPSLLALADEVIE